MPNATSGTLKDRTLTSLQIIGDIGSGSSKTGALTVRGGIGVSENVYIGGDCVVSGSIQIPGSVSVGIITIANGSQPGYVLTALDTSGNTEWKPNWVSGTSGNVYNYNNVSIGTTTVTEQLTIQGNMFLDGILKVPDTLNIYGNLSITGALQNDTGAYILPGVTDTLVGVSSSQNISNKTFVLPTISGDMDFNSSGKIINLNTPTNDADAATKAYVDGLITGLDWQESVSSITTTTPPVGPPTGTRYIVPALATGAWSGQTDNIAEWNGSSWDFTTPNEGYASLVEDEDKQYNYNGTSWVLFGSLVNHSSLIGLTNDEHVQYAHLPGRTGGQQFYGGINASDSMILESTTNATKGTVALQPNGGNVGIGITSALFQLHVSENLGNADQIVIEQNNTGGQAGLRIHHKDDGDSGYQIRQITTGQVNITQTSSAGHVHYFNKGVSSDYRFYNTNSDIERFAITSDGTIEISGNQRFTDATSNEILYQNELVFNNFLYLGSTGNVGLGISQATYQLETSLSALIGENLYIGTENRGLKNSLDLFSNDTNVTISTNSTQRIMIGATGNVGIASSNPQDALDVTGNIRVSGTINQGANTFTLPSSTDTLVGRASTDTLSNKNLVDNSTYIINNSDATKRLHFSLGGASTNSTVTLLSSHTDNRTLTLPDITDTLVSLTATQTLSNKTLTSPIISSISNTGTLTLPTSTDTLVGRDTVDTLTNKTIASPSFTGNLSLADATYVSTDQIRARDADGLLLTDDANLGMFIQDGGNVGIGSLTPSSKLDVLGDAKFNNNALFVKQSNNFVGINTNNPSTNLDVNGSVYVENNVTINGNLSVNGTLTTINSTTVTIDDPLFHLAENNNGDVVDIGIFGTYIEGGVTKYTGLFRDASDASRVYRLFDSLQELPTSTVNTSGTGYGKGDLYLGNMEADFVTIGTFASTYPLLINKSVTNNWSQRINNNLTTAYIGHSDGLGININTSSVSDNSYIALLGNTAYPSAFRLQNDGLVGIRTGSPSEILHVEGTAVGDGAKIGNAKIGVWEGGVNYTAFTHDTIHSTATSYALKQLNTGETYLNTADTKSLHFRVNDVDQVVVDSSGNVGIGTLSPQRKLHVEGGTLVTLDLDVYGDLNILGQVNAVQAETIVVNDPMFKLAHGNTVDLLDTGFYMEYGISAGVTPDGIRYAGIIRDNDDGIFKIFHNLEIEPGTTQVNTMDPSFQYASFAVGELNIESGTTTGFVNVHYAEDGTSFMNFIENGVTRNQLEATDDILYYNIGGSVVYRRLSDDFELMRVDQSGLNIGGSFTSDTLGITSTLTVHGESFLNDTFSQGVLTANQLAVTGSLNLTDATFSVVTNDVSRRNTMIVNNTASSSNPGFTAGTVRSSDGYAFQVVNNVTIDANTGLPSNDGTQLMVVEGNGHVGIGTNNPSNRLHVTETSAGALTYPLRLDNFNTTDGSGAGINFNVVAGDIQTASIHNIRNGSGDYSLILEGYTSGLVSNQMVLRNRGVGILTNNPDSILHMIETTAQTNIDGSDFLPTSFTHDLIIERRQSSVKDTIYGYQGPALEFRVNNSSEIWTAGSIVGLADPFGGSTHDGGLAFYTNPGGTINHNDSRTDGGLLAPAMTLGHDQRAYFTGNVGIGTSNPSTALEVNGNCTATQFITLSDVQAKENIRELSPAKCMETVNNLKVYEFDYKNQDFSSVGVLAQEVEEMFPQAVVEQNGTKYVNYQMLFVLMMGCIKDLSSKIHN